MILYIGLSIFYLLCISLEKTWQLKASKKIRIFFLMSPLFILADFMAPAIGNDILNYFNSYTLVS